VAKAWGIDVNKVIAWIRSGELRAINGAKKAGGKPRYLIDLADLEAFEAARSTVPVPRSTRKRRATENVTRYF
jgi:hypothetical protein